MAGKLDAELLDILPKTLSHICDIGSRIDSIDVEACKTRVIQVSNTPALAAGAVAETVLFSSSAPFVTSPFLCVRRVGQMAG